MKAVSAGLLCYRITDQQPEFLLAHPGGPFFKNKDNGFWTIVKGETEPNEDMPSAAKREFEEETGFIPQLPFLELGSITQKAGKEVHAWAFEMDFDLTKGFRSNNILIQWPPKTGRMISIPEIDKLEYFSLNDALIKINQAQRELIERLSIML